MIRGISQTVLDKYGAYTDSHKLYMPYIGEDFTQERNLSDDTKVRQHKADTILRLYGSSIFDKGGEELIIVEGEIEVLVVAEAFLRTTNMIPPIVGTTCHSNIPIVMLEESLDYIKSFDKIITAFDNDYTGNLQTNWILETVGDKSFTFDIKNCNDNYELIEEIGYDRYVHEFRNRTKRTVKKQKISGWRISH